MKPVDLSRQFVPLDAKDREHIEAFLASRSAYYLKDWPNVLEQYRVVILAEAGSGKTTELRARADALKVEGKFSFYATVQDVANEGLEGASGEKAEIAKWKRSDKEAWLFIDSVDEAKFNGFRFETALRRIKEAIESAASRAHIVISGRYTDWEFQGDLERLKHYLPVPSTSAELGEPTSEAVLIGALDGESRKQRKKEESEPTVWLMAPLDEERTKMFARAKKVADVDAFIAGIEGGDLWTFARRPIDLDWLTAYWLQHRRFGHLAQMMEVCLVERLREADPQRSRRDPLDPDRSMKALERVGAALVFGRTDKITVPDSTSSSGTPKAEFDLSGILPDWSDEQRTRLLSRPVFDPATFGRVRLHNDNTGEVRAYLTAQWLRARRDTNCTARALKDMLFQTIYGLDVIKPSLRDTAAWLSIWDRDVAREVIAREPLLLLTAGDPASLPIDIRREALKAIANELRATNQHVGIIDTDALRRYSTIDLIPEIRKLWTADKAVQGVREIILRMIALGHLSGCADIAEEAAFGSYTDRYTPVFAMRALLATAGSAARAKYAAKIKKEFAALEGIIVWESLESLFPSEISIAELLAMLRAIPQEMRDETMGLSYRGTRFVAKLNSKAELEEFLIGLLDILGAPKGEPGAENPLGEALLPSIDAAGLAVANLVASDTVPQVVAASALRLGEDRYGQGRRRDQPQLPDKLKENAKRREIMLWAATDHFRRNPGILGTQSLVSDWQLDFLGWSPGLKLEDFNWLLAAIKNRPNQDDQSVALNAAMRLWRENEKPPKMLSKIRAAAVNNQSLLAAIAAWVEPRQLSPQEKLLDKQVAANKAKRAKEEAKRNKSWIKFVDALKADPDLLRNAIPPTKERVDGRVFSLWELLHRLDENNSRYAIDSVKPLEAIVGAEVAEAEREALIKMWRQWKPTLDSERDPGKRNIVSKMDCMGVAGITLESTASSTWPKGLSSADASLAASYGTLELNGFPKWMAELAQEFPEETSAVLMTEVISELIDDDAGRFGVLHDLSYASPPLARIVFRSLLEELKQRPKLTPNNLSLVLRVLTAGIPPGDKEFAKLAMARFVSATDPGVEAAYAAAAFRFNPSETVNALSDKLNGLALNDQALLAQRLLPKLFGSRITEEADRVEGIPFDVLLRLVDLAFQTIRVEDDNQRLNGKVYSPDDRDNAEQARGRLFTQLIETPGRSTFDALNALATKSDFPIPPYRLKELATQRARTDAENSSWPVGEAWAMEKECDTAPATPLDLQRVALLRISDIQHDAIDHDFAQGGTLKSLPNEMAVQKWVASELNFRKGRAYSIERESRVADEKAPDFRLRSKSSSASLPIEVKVAESWTLEELESALTDQLVGLYLRDKDNTHGVLLLVHQKFRPRGWIDKKKNVLTFEQVVAYLEQLATIIAGKAPSAPQAMIGVIDVSRVAAISKPNARAKRKKSAKKERGAKTARRVVRLQSKKRAVAKTDRQSASRKAKSGGLKGSPPLKKKKRKPSARQVG